MQHDTTSDRSAILRPGDRVAVATSFGHGPIREHTAIGIFTRESDELPEIPWADLTDRAIVVDLDGNKWAYGYQLRPLPVDLATIQPSAVPNL